MSSDKIISNPSISFNFTEVVEDPIIQLTTIPPNVEINLKQQPIISDNKLTILNPKLEFDIDEPIVNIKKNIPTVTINSEEQKPIISENQLTILNQKLEFDIDEPVVNMLTNTPTVTINSKTLDEPVFNMLTNIPTVNINSEEQKPIISENQLTILNPKLEFDIDEPIVNIKTNIPPVTINSKTLDEPVFNMLTNIPPVTINSKTLDEPVFNMLTNTPTVTINSKTLDEPVFNMLTNTPTVTINSKTLDEPIVNMVTNIPTVNINSKKLHEPIVNMTKVNIETNIPTVNINSEPIKFKDIKNNTLSARSPLNLEKYEIKLKDNPLYIYYMAFLAQYLEVNDNESIDILLNFFNKKNDYKNAIDYLVKYLQLPTTRDDTEQYCKYLGYLRAAYELKNDDIQEYIKYLKITIK